MKKAVLLILAALVIPGAAFAKPAPQATYALKGTLSSYTAYNAATKTNGSVTILVAKASDNAKALVGQSLTFPVDMNTKLELAHGLTTVTNGDNGSVEVRAAKDITPANLAATLQASPAQKVHDEGAPKVPPTVTYELKGTLSGYAAYSSPTNGSITILVAHGNKVAKSFKGQTLTFPVDANTKISLADKLTTITNGDTGVVKVRAPKGSNAAALQAMAAKQVVDQGVKH
jgi:hypothetical protein